MTLRFETAKLQHKELIFDWLAQSFIKEFWDNSQAHKDDIMLFMNGRQTPSNYFNGTIVYWVGFLDDRPFCFLLTDKLSVDENLTELQRAYLSKTGHTIAIDFCIGDINYLGKGLAAQTLKVFTEFYKSNIDQLADTFFIDPDEKNPKAAHVYVKAGFNPVGEFSMQKGVFTGQKTLLLVKNME